MSTKRTPFAELRQAHQRAAKQMVVMFAPFEVYGRAYERDELIELAEEADPPEAGTLAMHFELTFGVSASVSVSTGLPREANRCWVTSFVVRVSAPGISTTAYGGQVFADFIGPILRTAAALQLWLDQTVGDIQLDAQKETP